MPMDRKLYPRNWEELSHRIRFERAGGLCERCGVAHGAKGARDLSGQWHDEHSIICMKSDVGEALFGEYPKIIRIILTCAHLDHNVKNNADDNLMALCQLCHNRHDVEYRTRNRAMSRIERLREKEKQVGQLNLMEV